MYGAIESRKEINIWIKMEMNYVIWIFKKTPYLYNGNKKII